MSITQYLKKRRMEKACRLLETSFEPVKSISIEVGYHDPDYFEREFKKVCGSTPSEYRREYLTQVAIKRNRAQKKRRILQ
jgi:YesN/AraC family two-component response regulator